MQQVDQELLTCNALASSGAFRIGSFEDERFYWPWPAKVNANVTENGRFVYIDGAFRPEPQHILKLLGGVELYRDPMVAVRELLQNALDAVKEQIARQRLLQDNSGDPAWQRKLGELHKVSLSLIEDEHGMWLVCSDSGVGMTRGIIERHLLVSGASALAEVHQLEREANACGFSVERSGQFGIGVLSYFMLADRVVIVTRRSDLAGGDPEGASWRFETDGLEGFGELTKASRDVHGTEVRLRIKDDIRQFPKWGKRLVTFVRESISYLPCTLDLVEPDNAKTVFPQGWCQTTTTFLDQLIESFRRERRRAPSTEDEFVPAEEARKLDDEDARWDAFCKAAAQCVRLFGPIEGELPGKHGRYRIHLLYFELEGEASLAYIDMEEGTGRMLPEAAHAFLARSQQFYSWSGFRVHARMAGQVSAHLTPWVSKFIPLTVKIIATSEVN